MKVLLIEDDDIAAEAVARAFRNSELELVRAVDGIEGLEVLRGGGGPRVILLDLRLPRLSGIEILDEIRADPGLAGSIVFALTTSTAPADKAASYRRGVAGYIVKSTGGLEQLVRLLEAYEKVVELPG